jgi:UDP-3-O-[3-hydroxymyristoyl] glucosamine N-acyltransferase
VRITLKKLADLVEGRLDGPADRTVSDVKGIENAGPEDISFLSNPRFARMLPECRAGVVLVKPDQEVPEGLAVIRVEDPQLAFAKILAQATAQPYVSKGVHPQAVVEESAVLGRDVTVSAMAYIGEGAQLGDRTLIHPGVYIGPQVKVGEDTVIHPNVVIYQDCQVGRRCIIHAGTIIGADGFGFVPDGRKYFKIPQVGVVQIDDDVELGALNAIDRAANNKTWIQRGVKTDNMVHIAHNCVIGEDTLLVAQVGISGSCRLGRHVVLGGQVGLGGHITLGDNVMVGAQSGVAKSVDPGGAVTGTPAMPHRLFLKVSTLIKRLPQLFERVAALESRLTNLDRAEDEG